MQTSKYQLMSLDELKNELTSNKAKASYQLQEIERTKGYIATFEDCIKQQKDALTKYILERAKLKEEKVKLTALQGIDFANINTNCDASSSINDDLLRTPSKRRNDEALNNELVTKKICAENCIIKNENRIVKSELGFGGSASDKDSSDIKSESDLNPRRKWERSKFINNKIYEMMVYHNIIFLCGSNGMLLMITVNETINLETDCFDDIRQMTLFKYRDTVSLAAISANHLIIYIDILKMQIPEKISVKVRGNIFQDRHVIYLPVIGEEIRKFNKDTCKIESHLSHSHGNVRFFVPCMKNEKKKALISLEDRMLYKTLENDFDILEVIDGVKNVKNLLRIGSSKYVCSSKKKLWILDSTPAIIEEMKFDSSIKFLVANQYQLVVVDDSNKLFVYEVNNTMPEDGVSPVHEQQYHTTISCLSLYKTKIYLLIQDEIVVLKICK